MSDRSFLPRVGVCLMAGLAACGESSPTPHGATQVEGAAGAQNITIAFVPTPDSTPLHGMVEGADFAIKSIVFTQAINADQRQELQVAIADIPNYCNVLTSGAAADGFVARLRLVNMGVGGVSLAADANDYLESTPPNWTGYVSDIPPPGAQAASGAAAPLPQGHHMTGGFTRLKSRCTTQQLNPAFVGSNASIDALDATGARGSALLWFSDTVGTTTGFTLSGTFTATPCAALAADMARTPFAAFTPPAECASE